MLPFGTKKSGPPTGGQSNSAGGRESRILVPDLRGREYPHWKGSCWVRILPPIEGSEHNTWFLRVPILTRGNIKSVDPEFFGERSLYKEAHKAIKNSNDPTITSRIYHPQQNPGGIRCWPADHYVGWVMGIDPPDGKFQLVILNASDGSFGPTQLGHKVILAAAQVDNDPSTPADKRGKPRIEDATSVTKGHHLNLRKVGEGTSASYEATFSPTETDITPLFEAIPAEELAMLRPLEKALHCPSLEEQCEILDGIVGRECRKLLLPDTAEIG